MTERSLHPGKQALFVLLSAADFAMTWLLLERLDGGSYEANPVADWWLARHGWAGLALFKALVVGVVLSLATVIALRKPRTAGHLLRLACAIVGVVVVYGAALGATAPLRAEEETAYLAQNEALNRQTAEENRGYHKYRVVLCQLRDEVLAGNCTVVEAASRLEECGTDNSRVQRMLARYASRPQEQRFACWVVCHVVNSVHDPEKRADLVSRLEAEFEEGYGESFPSELRARLELTCRTTGSASSPTAPATPPPADAPDARSPGGAGRHVTSRR